MKIKELHIDGFGVWNDLKLEGLGDRISVFYGPNEAGKSTLLQFVRSVLYGVSPARRERYFPPLRGGRPGGWVKASSPQGSYTLQRYDDSPAAVPEGVLRILAENGQTQHEQLLRTLLCGIDEAIFNNVFAVGLREMQELGSLEDTAAADLLYKLSTGMDRVSLVDVSRELSAARTRLLSTDDRPSQITNLVQRREQLQAEIDTLHETTAQYSRLIAQREQLDGDVERAEQAQHDLDRRARLLDIAIAVRDKWQQRIDLDAQLEALAHVKRLPNGLPEAVERLNQKLDEHRKQAEEHKRNRLKVKDEQGKLSINDTLWRRAPHVQALLDQQQWLAKLEEELRALDAERQAIERDLSASRARTVDHPTIHVGGTTVSAEAWAVLLPAARNLSKALRKKRHEEESLRRVEANAETAGGDVRAVLAARQESSLPKAVEKAGHTVTQFRRRLQVEERLEQLKRHHMELLDDSHGLLDRQLLPPGWVATLGGLFAAGVAMAFMGVFAPNTTSTGWYIVLGMVGVFGSLLIKRGLEHSAAQSFADAQREINLVESQLNEMKAERDQLESELPQTSGTVGTRLKAAEQELTRLEELMGADNQRKFIEQDVESAKRELKQAEEAAEVARRRWKQAIQNAGLPQTLTMTQLKELRNVKPRNTTTDELARKIDRCRQDIDNRQREIKAFADRVAQMFADVQLEPRSGKIAEQLKQLQDEVKAQEAKLLRQRQLHKRSRHLRRLVMREIQIGKKIQARRRKYLRRGNVKDETELRQRLAQLARIDQLTAQRDQLTREIGNTIGQLGTEEVIREYFEEYKPSQLEKVAADLNHKRALAANSLQQSLEQRGRLAEQMNQLAQDRRLAQKMLDLSIVDQQLREAAERWQTLAITGKLLETIRKTFEADRQPETLREASEFLVRLTEGHYRRVWTPMDRDTLLVDDDEGHTIPVEVLSRGTREQVFLSLRLALVAAYGRRGALLPVVLDDVLVNFDAGRALAAAKVLLEFATGGHQMLVFTCHEHIAQLFHKLDARVFKLPNNHQPGAKVAIPLRIEKPVAVAPPPPPPKPQPIAPIVVKQVVVPPPPPPISVSEPTPPAVETKTPKPARRRKVEEPPQPRKTRRSERGQTRVRRANDFFAGSQWHDPVEDDGNDHGEHGLHYDCDFTEEDALWYGIDETRSPEPSLAVHHNGDDSEAA